MTLNFALCLIFFKVTDTDSDTDPDTEITNIATKKKKEGKHAELSAYQKNEVKLRLIRLKAMNISV